MFWRGVSLYQVLARLTMNLGLQAIDAARENLRFRSKVSIKNLIPLSVGVALLGCSDTTNSNAVAVACSPPRSYWQKPHNFQGLQPLHNEVSLDKTGTIYWNGERITEEEFVKLLKLAHVMNPEPEIFLQTEMGVSCRRLEATRDQMDEALECKRPYSSCAEGIRSIWRNIPTPLGQPPS
jgi:hypothetical protein